MARSLTELEPEFRDISDRARRLAGTLDPATLMRRPRPESWSVAECLAHLNLSVDAYFPVWARELVPDRRKGAAASGNYRLDFWGRILIWTLEPPPKFRFPAPRNFQPPTAVSAETILQEFLDRQDKIIAALHAADGIAIDRIKIVSPFDARVRYSIWSSFRVTAAHERRHLWQAERAAQALR